MKYVSIDIETTGLYPETCQVLSFGAIIEDAKKPLPFRDVPKFYRVLNHRFITGQPFALNMNKGLIKEIKDGGSENLTEECFLVPEFSKFLRENGLGEQKINLAGKNLAFFDIKFLERLPGWDKIKYHRRIIDPAMLYLDFDKDEFLPSLSLCKEKAGFKDEVTHNALSDAWDVVRVIRENQKSMSTNFVYSSTYYEEL